MMRNHNPSPGALLKSLLICLLMMIISAGHAQNPASNLPLKFPWAGGLNSCQFCAIDLNSDGTNDLLIFDRQGNRRLTFINHGTPNTVDYSFAPEYALKLPELHDWVITADYNCDGRMDIFTYGMGGVRVFENISDTILKFRMVTDLLESFYYTGKVGILVTSVDYPTLSDIDNDGDLDLLTFFGLGSYVEYHKNLSMEKYGTCDSLDFKLSDHCWGKFKESEGGNRITLNAGCPYSDSVSSSRHTGSTLLATDLNNDGLKDLILGDVDYPGIVALYNGGTHDSAFMVAQDTSFPSYSRPVHQFSFPAVSLIDVDNDGLNDLVVSPFDPSLHTSDNYNCVWYYKNTGSNSLPHFEFQAEQLFRGEMMDFGSASHPVLYDFDENGLPDLFVGNDGMYDSSLYINAQLHSYYSSGIAYFVNTGTASLPVFKYVTSDLAGISRLNLRGAYPALGNLNGDNWPDLLIGSSDGTLIFFKNLGTNSWIPEFDAPVIGWQGVDVGDYSTPQIFDLDKDNKPDLVIGEQNGNLNYYKNAGTADNPMFILVTDSLGKVNVTNYNLSYDGFSTPCFSRLSDGTTFLAVGSEEGRVHLFKNIDNNLGGRFTDAGGLFDWLSPTPADTLFGWQTSPALGHLTDPEAFDMILGNFSGGLNYITKRVQGEIIPGISSENSRALSTLKVYPNPADQSVTVEVPDDFTRNPSPVMIVNRFGQKVLELLPGAVNTIRTGNLPSGIYVVRCAEASAKLMIVHP